MLSPSEQRARTTRVQSTLVGILATVAALPAARADPGAKAAALLRKAEAACSTQDYPKGVDLAFKAATTAHGAPARHPVRRRWRPVARACFNAWIRNLGGTCSADLETVKNMEQLSRIAAQTRKIAEAGLARMAMARRRTCLASLPARIKKYCSQEPSAAAVQRAREWSKRLALLSGDIPAKTTTAVKAAVPFCVSRWLAGVAARCQAQPQVGVLRELGSVVAASPAETRPAARAAYQACATQMGSYAWQLCQRHEYRKGRVLLKEAVGRYDFFKADDRTFLTKMKKEYLPRCGTYAAAMNAKVVARTGGVTLEMQVKVRIVLARTSRSGHLVGIARIRPQLTAGRSPSGKVLATLKGGQYVLKGKHNPRTGNVAWWTTGPPTPGEESVQVNRAGRAAVVFRDSIVDDLLKAARVLSMWMSGRAGAQRTIRFDGQVGGGRQGKINGTLTMGRLK